MPLNKRDNDSASGFFCLILHAHLPFVRRPDHKSFLEENWLFEAITETYLPFLSVLDRCEASGKKPRLAVSLSPTLISMLADEFLRQRYREYLKRQLKLCLAERKRVAGHSHEEELVELYYHAYSRAENRFAAIHGDLLARFRHYADSGMIELLTSCATHAFLPLYRSQPALIRLQLTQGMETFRKYLCRQPSGLWLPECGYYWGLEEHIKASGYEYFIVSSKALEGGNCPKRGIFAPVDCRNGSHAFICDRVLTGLVWDAKFGYPSKGVYRDFYRDIGFDLPLDYLQPYLPCPDRAAAGLKYYASGEMGVQPLYDIEAARRQTISDADHFCQQIEVRCSAATELVDRPPLSCCAFDAELFGHWWFEGPEFLEQVFSRLTSKKAVQMVSPDDYSQLYPANQRHDLVFSSWGDGGFAQSWLDSSNSWIYQHIYGTAINLQIILRLYRESPSITQMRMLNQALRELLLAMASDWPMIIASGSMSGYAERCIRQHLCNCQKICASLASHSCQGQELAALETINAIFPNLDYRDFANEIERVMGEENLVSSGSVFL